MGIENLRDIDILVWCPAGSVLPQGEGTSVALVEATLLVMASQ